MVKTQFTQKTQLVAALKQQLGTNDAQVVKGLIPLFVNQTASEQASGSVQVWNMEGFTGSDAQFLTSLATQAKKHMFYGKAAGEALSPKQLAILHKKMPKYARQLVEGSLAEKKIVKEDGVYCFL